MNYDIEEDILFLTKGKKVKASIDIGDFIIDIDHQGSVSGMEILNASQNLNIPETLLNSLEKASMKVTYKSDHIIITLLLQSKEKQKDVSIPLTVDLGHTKLETQETNFAFS